MAHTYTSILVHMVFSTRERKKLIMDNLRDRLWSYMGGITKQNDMTALAIGGVEDHVHLLLGMPASLSVSKAAQLIKGGSSKWIHDTFPDLKEFSWQDGYGAFTVSISGVEETTSYIKTQAEHHRKVTFEEEFQAFLRKHAITYDPKFVFG